ncbi:MAG: hypothetical protein PHX27_02895, partial [Candidatus ainarchaeum sp.]|nr:hypothetical protein [Candidatus ainarchaeum sp.]
MQEKNLTIISIIFFAIILILSFILIITISFETQLIENNNKINSNLINSNQKNLLSLQENNEIFFDKPYFKQVFFDDPGYVICDDGWHCMGECIPATSYCDLSGGCQSYGSGTVCSDWSDPGDCDPNNNACVPASCEGNCGGLAGGIGGACFCDEVCTGYGDCCPDYEDFCTHQECNPDNFTCELIKEPGDDTCSEDTNCFHHECNSISLTCEKKAGPGEDTCETPEDCYEICNVDNEKCKIGDCNPIKVCEGCDCVEDPNQTVCSGKTFGNECEDSGYCQSINSHSEYYCDVTGACVYYGSTCDSDYHSECNPSDNTCEAFSCKDNCYGWYEDYAGYYCECNDWCTDWGVCCPGYNEFCAKHSECDLDTLTCVEVNGPGENECEPGSSCLITCGDGTKCDHECSA